MLKELFYHYWINQQNAKQTNSFQFAALCHSRACVTLYTSHVTCMVKEQKRWFPLRSVSVLTLHKIKFLKFWVCQSTGIDNVFCTHCCFKIFPKFCLRQLASFDNSNFRSAIWLTYFEKLLISDRASFSLVTLFHV